MENFYSLSLTLLLLLTSLSVVNSAVASPLITNLIINDNSNEVEIEGSNFGDGPHVIYFDNFEEGTRFESQFNNIKWSPTKGTVKDISGNNELQARNPNIRIGDKGMQQLIINFGDVYTEAFIAFSVRVPEQSTFAGAESPRTFPAMSSWKFTWLMLGNNGFQNPDFDICLPTHVGGGNFLLGGNNGNLTWIEAGNHWWEWDNSNHISSYIKIDTSNPTTTPINYFWTVTNNFINTSPTLKTVPPSNFNSNSLAFDRINIPGWFGNGNNDRFDGRYDNIYIAAGKNALARVIVTDSPVFEKSKFSIPITTKTWTASKITLNKYALPNKTLYIYIVDSNGARSLTPAKIVCTKCPKPPIPL